MKTLIATLVVAATAFTAVPAQADDRAVFGAVIGAIIGYELTRDRNDGGYDNNRRHGSYDNGRGDYNNVYNDRRRPGYAAGLDNPRRVCEVETIRRTHEYTVIVERNCYGDILGQRRVWR